MTLADRKSHLYIAIKVADRTATVVVSVIIDALNDFSDELVKTITFGRGKEFSTYEKIRTKL